MGFVPENQVRTRLPAGGKWIRTFGPSQGMSQIRTVGAERDIGRRKRRFLYGGTDGSNPVPSGSQSVSLVPSAATGTKGPAFAANVSLDETRERDMRVHTPSVFMENVGARAEE